jgi:hypothetical protein
MSQADAVTRVSQIQAQIAMLQGAFTPHAAQAATNATAPAGATTATPQPGATTFANALSQAQATTQPTSGTASVALSAKALGMLTNGQQQFASRLATDTGLNPQVIAAWLLAEESGGAAQSRESASNNDWLNIGYTDSGTFGSADSVWRDPITAADATAGWLKGQDTIPGYGRAAAGIQAIMQTASQTPQAQMSAISNSGWASGGYPDMATLYAQVGGT